MWTGHWLSSYSRLEIRIPILKWYVPRSINNNFTITVRFTGLTSQTQSHVHTLENPSVLKEVRLYYCHLYYTEMSKGPGGVGLLLRLGRFTYRLSLAQDYCWWYRDWEVNVHVCEKTKQIHLNSTQRRSVELLCKLTIISYLHNVFNKVYNTLGLSNYNKMTSRRVLLYSRLVIHLTGWRSWRFYLILDFDGTR